MIYFYLIIIAYFALLFILQIIFIVLILLDKKEKTVHLKAPPFVSVLLAVRNEEKCVVSCLESLAALNWPKDKIEVLIGDDSSEDNTESLVRKFIEGKENFKLFSIKSNLGLAKGKANVLAQLARKAKGDFFCITDADILVPSGWVHGLISTAGPETGTVSGVALVKEEGAFSRFQGIDWIHALGMIRLVSKYKFPVTAVGNNMMVSREAYFSTGGYENIPFSLTEDFELFRQTLKKGWGFKNLLQPEVLAFTFPVKSLKKLFQQRRRWMTGAVQLPPFLIFVLGYQGFFFPFLVLALVILPFGWLLWLTKAILQLIFTFLVLKKVGRSNYIRNYPFYELLGPFVSFMQMVFYLLPGEVDWKGRKYKYKL